MLVAAYRGLRFGELTALTRDDITVAEDQLPTVHVARAMNRLEGKWLLGTPKSEAGLRTVALPEYLRPVLVAHLEQFVHTKPIRLKEAPYDQHFTTDRTTSGPATAVADRGRRPDRDRRDAEPAGVGDTADAGTGATGVRRPSGVVAGPADPDQAPGVGPGTRVDADADADATVAQPNGAYWTSAGDVGRVDGSGGGRDRGPAAADRAGGIPAAAGAGRPVVGPGVGPRERLRRAVQRRAAFN